MNRFLWPLIGFAVLLLFLAVGLSLNPRELPSPLISRVAPPFALPKIDAPEQTFSPQEMRGKVWLLNVWASWCVSCRQEHPLLVDLAKKNLLPIVGLNYKEVRGDGALDIDSIAPDAERPLALERAADWLNKHGNPYTLSVLDLDGRVGIDYGVYGVPESYVIDKTGVIRFKHVGVLTQALLSETILPLVTELSK